MMQDRLFQAARLPCDRINHCLPSLELNLLSIIEELGILWKMTFLEEITSGFLLRLELSVVPCEGVQAKITGLPAVVRVGPSMERGKVCDEQ
jgi:hypothetical protein